MLLYDYTLLLKLVHFHVILKLLVVIYILMAKLLLLFEVSII